MAHTRASASGNSGSTAKTIRSGSNGPPPHRPLISVFGSSQARRGGQLYATAHKLGEMLGRAGFDLMTGGYTGVMEAASRGGHAAGAQITGVTLERFRERMNPYVVREIRTSNFYDRLAWLINQADGYVALSGGIGTLAEVTFAWQELLLEMISPRPLILIGDRWKRTFQAFRAQLIGPRKLYDPVTFVATPEQALYRLSEHFPHLTSASQSM